MATIEDLKGILSHKKPHEIAIEISGFTGHRTTLIDELTPDEIEKLYKIHDKTNAHAIYEETMRRTWISKILTIATDEGIKEPNGWTKFNEWMLNSSRFKKHLNAHSLDELKLLHQQFCKLRDNNEKSAQKPMTKPWLKKAIKNKDLN